MRHDPAIRSRRFTMLEVAALMGLTNKAPKERRRHVKRVIRRLERRDGVAYLHADSPGGKLYVSLSALEQLIPWSPATLTKMRGDLDSLATTVKTVQKRLTRAEKDICELGGDQLESARLVDRLLNKWGQKGAERGHPQQE